MHNPLGNFTEGGDDMVLFTTAVCLQQAELTYYNAYKSVDYK